MYFRGRAIRLWPGCTTSWRVLVEKPSEGSGTYINAVGFAILDPSNPGKVLAAYEWNEDGQPYPMDAVRCKNAGGFPVRDLKINCGVRPFFRGDDVIEVKVTHESQRILATVAVNGESARRGIEMRDCGKYTMLRVEPLERDGRKDDVAPVLGREGTLVVAPFCDLCRGSSASLTWSPLADSNSWQTWREHKEGKKIWYEPRLAPPLPPGMAQALAQERGPITPARRARLPRARR
jgi:hypothetical protein